MALFFDRAWFEARLAVLGLPRTALAAAAGVDAETLELMFKDQREVRPHEAAAFALVLGVSPEEAAMRCGVSTRAPGAGAPGAPGSPPGSPPWAGATAAGEARLAAMEACLALLEARLAAAEARLAHAEARLADGPPAGTGPQGAAAGVTQPG